MLQLEYLTFFVKRLIQRIPHYIRFNLNGLKVLEHYDHIQRTLKGDFLNQNNLGITHTDRIMPTCFQGPL